jgi:hypothetical protein
MARGVIFVAIAAALAAVWPSSGFAATPPGAPALTSAPYVYPFTMQWAPSTDVLNLSQTVSHQIGICAGNTAAAAQDAVLAANETTYTGTPSDGTYCYFVSAADLLTTARGPGLTVVVDTTNPTSTVEVSGQLGGIVSGIVSIKGTSSDAVSGVNSSVLRAGAVGSCPTGRVVGSSWDTTTFVNGRYDVCNVVTDNAGHVAIDTTTVTVANAFAPPGTPTFAAAEASTPAAPIQGTGADKVAPRSPTKVSVVLPRSKVLRAKVRVTLRWVKPVAPDLARVIVVLNLRRAPRGPADGQRVYNGLGTSVALNMQAGEVGYAALFAYDISGNASPAARRVIALPSLSPLRPLAGSVLKAPPLLAWKAKQGSKYYNVQLFRNGKRVLVAWPSVASYQLPRRKLGPGNYVWYVWPAVRISNGTPVFGDLIGRANFVLTR